LCKTKTLEYRILRKLREKLKTLLNQDSKDSDKIYAKFVSEVNSLCKNNLPFKPLDHFYTIAKTAFDFVKTRNKLEIEIIAARYISFLDLVKKSIDTNEKIISREFL
jgi:hypothetical protein